MWPGPEGGGLEGGGGGSPQPHPHPPSPPEGDLIDPRDTSHRLTLESDENDQLPKALKQAQPQGTKSRLALIQSRAKSKRELALIRPDQGDPSKQSDPKTAAPVERKRQSNKANKGKVNMVREQLEQNRLRFERRGQELNESTKTMEEKLEQLRQQLEERDVSIQQLQSGEFPIVDVQPEPVGLNDLLKERDAKLAEMNRKISDLENTIVDMQENLKEKDSVIEARTQAITLLSEDLSKKRKTTVDTLEETRQQMKIMQENFIGIEAGLTAEIEQLTQSLEMKNHKIHQLEFNLAQAEEVRVELMVRNAELEEKLTITTTQNTDSAEELKAKVEELTKLLLDANMKSVALEAEKKALNKQLKSLRKGMDANEEIIKLQNHVAELEEEKAAESIWQKRIEELELKLKLQSEDLENHGHMITLLESDKLDVLANFHEQSRELEELRSYISELEKEKVKINETKSADVDEQWSLVTAPKSEDTALLEELADATRRVAEADAKITEQDEIIQELKLKLSQMESDKDKQESALANLSSEHETAQESILTELKLELKESRGALAEWKWKCEQVEAELESVSAELRGKEKEFSELEKKLLTYEQEMTFKVDDIEKDLQIRKTKVRELEEFVKELSIRASAFQEISANQTAEPQIEEVTEVSELHPPLEDQEANLPHVECAQQEQLQQASILGELSGEVEKLRLELQERELVVSNLSELLREKSEVVAELERRLDSIVSTCEKDQGKIAEAETLIEKLRSELEIAERGAASEVIVERDDMIALKGALELKNDECQRLEGKLRTQAEKLKRAMVNLKAKTVANNDLSDKVTKLQSAVESNQALLDNLSKDKNEILEKWQTESSEKVEVMNALASVRHALEETKREVFELTQQIGLKDLLLAETKASLDEKLAQVADLETLLSEKSAQLAEKSAASPAEHKDRDTGNSEDTAKDAQFTKLQNVAKALKVKLAKEKKIRAEFEERVSSLEESLAEKTSLLEESWEKLSQQNHAFEAKVQEYEAYVDSLKQELDRERQQLCHLSESFAETEHRCKHLENICQKLEQQLSEVHQQGANELEKELNRRRLEAEERERAMVRELHGLREENKELAQNLSEAELSTKALRLELGVTVERLTQLEKESARRAEWEEEANSATNDVLALEAKLRSLAREHKQQLDDQMREMNQIRDSLQNELDDAREHINRIEAEMTTLKGQLSMATRVEQDLGEELQQKETELDEMRQVVSSIEDQCKQQVAEMTADIESYKHKVCELESSPPSTAHLFLDGSDFLEEDASARISELNTTVRTLTGELEMMRAQAKKSESSDVIDERPSIPQELDTHVTAWQLMSSLNSIMLELEAELNQVWSERDQALAQIDQLMNNSLPRDDFCAYNMDESLMEKNMNKLESELTGMVTSQQEGLQRQISKTAVSAEGAASEMSWSMVPTGQSDEDVWKYDEPRPEMAENLKEKFSLLEQRIKKKLSRMSLHLKQGAGDNRTYSQGLDDSLTSHSAAEDRYQDLITQIKGLESERNDALSQMKTLRAEVDKLTSGMEKGLTLEEAAVNPTPTTETAPGWGLDDPDGWGWEDKTEEETLAEQQKEPQSPTEQLAAVKEKLTELESERERWENDRLKLSEDLRTAQVRSVKLVKKLKEMKQKYETTKTSTSSSLDQALEEEFLIQIKNLEKEISEVRAELTSIRSERGNLSKQVFMLSSANEKFVEMKERQDFEVAMWQKRSDDLTKKVTALEWEIDELKNEKAESVDCLKCGELEKQIAVLCEESEALQSVLTKQKEEQLASPKSSDMNPVAVEQLLQETHTWSSKYETLMQEYQQVRAQCFADTEKITRMEPALAEVTAVVERLENEKKYLQDVHDSLKMEFESVSAQLKQQQELQAEERLAHEGELSTRHLEETLLREKYQEVCTENEQIRERCRKLENEIKELVESERMALEPSVEKLEAEINQLKRQLSSQAADLSAKEQDIDKLEQVVLDVRTQLVSSAEEVAALHSEREELSGELAKLSAETAGFQARLEAEIAQLRGHLSEQAAGLTSKEQNIEKLEAEVLDLRSQLRSAFEEKSQIRSERDRLSDELAGLRAETDTPLVEQPQEHSVSDWFSAQTAESHPVGTPPTSVLNWDAIVSGSSGADVFDSIQKTHQTLTSQPPPVHTVTSGELPPVRTVTSGELEAKEAELQKMTRLVETLKLTHSEAEQEWSQAMEYTKNQLSAAKEELERIKEVLLLRERELCQCQEELAAKDRELKAALQSKQTEVESLQAQLAEREHRLTALQDGELSQLHLELAEKEQLLLQVQAKRDHDLADANQQIVDLKSKLSQKEWQMTEITMARERELAMRDEAKGKELKEQIAEKDQQLSEERQRLQAQIEALQMTSDQQNATIHQLQSQLAADSPAVEEMRLYAEEQNKTIQELRTHLENVSQELSDTRQYSQQQADTLRNIQLLQQSNEEEIQRLRQSQQNLTDLQNQIQEMGEKLSHREAAIERLQNTISWMEQERSSWRSDEELVQLETNLSARENELALLRQELVLKEEFVAKLESELQAKDTEIQELQDKIQRLEMKRMWDAEVKANREAAARLEQTALASGDAANKGIRSDLDEALNMLHQRDVRCEELTSEIMRLLEERDSLQLRLSSALRTNEDLRVKIQDHLDNSAKGPSAAASNQGLRSSVTNFSPDTSLADVSAAADGSSHGLANNDWSSSKKLAELKRVGYSRDVRIKDESERRHKEQMRLITSSPLTVNRPMPMAAPVPSILVPSAPPASEVTTVEGTGPAVDLVPADSFDAQDEQSTSLLDWIWGRSSHQIVDI